LADGPILEPVGIMRKQGIDVTRGQREDGFRQDAFFWTPPSAMIAL
jgi:hypothetical protein